ncbi:MAG: hypothetical protein K0R67_653 [Paenibacillus sp.]|nr:hypothetical protein [Paenibacillus sp.]
MTPCYLSMILLCLTFILLASGWKNELLPGISDRSLLVFTASWIILSQIQINLPSPTITDVNLVVLLLVWLVVQNIWASSTWLAAFHFISIGLFQAALFYLLCYFAQADPMFFPYHSPAVAAVFLGLVTALLTRNAFEQVGVVTFALLVGTGLYAVVMNKGHSSYSLLFGGRLFQDQWWAAVASVRLASLCIHTVWAFGSGAVKSWSTRNEVKKGGREE